MYQSISNLLKVRFGKNWSFGPAFRSEEDENTFNKTMNIIIFFISY